MRSLAVLTLCGILATGCAGDAENVMMAPVNNSWHAQNKLNFSYQVTDSQNPKNIIFVVRNNNDYPYSNLRLIVDMLDVAAKKKQTDTLNYILAEPSGRWIGSGYGETKETLFQYRMGYRFPKNGKYEITVRQAMRSPALKGIEDFGIRIEPAKP